MELLIKAELISNTELKLCRFRQTSPTVAHFSITVARAEGDWRLRISDATSELVCKGNETSEVKQQNQEIKAKEQRMLLRFYSFN